MSRPDPKPQNKMLARIDNLREPVLRALEEVPILGRVVKFYGIGDSIADTLFLNKIRWFIEGFEEVGGPKATAFAGEIHSDERVAERAAEAVLLSINAITDLEKALVLAYIYAAYLKDEIHLDTLRRLLSAVNQSMVDDLWALADPAVDSASRDSDVWRANRSAILALRTTGLTSLSDSAHQFLGKRSLIGTETTELGKILIGILRAAKWSEHGSNRS
jgi:hypothetical protein